MRYSALIAFLSTTIPAAFGAGASLHLLQKPAMNKTQIVFSYAGDLWSVPREGGVATRLTAGVTDPACLKPRGPEAPPHARLMPRAHVTNRRTIAAMPTTTINARSAGGGNRRP